jgi:hypothetical protein
MPAHSDNFPWPNYYNHFDYFEGAMQQHRKIASIKMEGSGVYRLVRLKGDTLRIFICDCYAFGVAEYMETVKQLGAVDVVIINSAWCDYSPDAKWHCRNEHVGLFRIGEFMSALHRDDYWAHLTDQEKEYFKEKGLL